SLSCTLSPAIRAPRSSKSRLSLRVRCAIQSVGGGPIEQVQSEGAILPPARSDVKEAKPVRRNEIHIVAPTPQQCLGPQMAIVVAELGRTVAAAGQKGAGFMECGESHDDPEPEVAIGRTVRTNDTRITETLLHIVDRTQPI